MLCNPPSHPPLFTQQHRVCSLRGVFCMITLIKTLLSRCFCWPFGMTSATGTIRLPDDEEDKSEGPTSRRRALLVGISYKGDRNKWPVLDGPHEDVDRFRHLLTGTLSYTSLGPFPSTSVLFPRHLWISPGRHYCAERRSQPPRSLPPYSR